MSDQQQPLNIPDPTATKASEGHTHDALRYGLTMIGLQNRIAALERQGYRVIHPKVMASRWRRFLIAVATL